MTYDVIVIGTGPGGYVAAIRAAQLGKKVAVVEKRATHGGTCLNVGCIPSKALLHASELYAEAANGFAGMGIKVKPELDLAAMLAFKDEGVKGNVQGVEFLLKKNKIDHFHGTGRIVAPGKVEVTFINGEKQVVEAKDIVIATGSEVAAIPGIAIDEKTDHLLDRRAVAAEGAEAPGGDRRRLYRARARLGVAAARRPRSPWSRCSTVSRLASTARWPSSSSASSRSKASPSSSAPRCLGVESDGTACKVQIEPAKGGAAETLDCDVVLVSVGRVPNTQGLGLADIGVKTDNRGRIQVDQHYATNVPGIYAIGDVIAGPMLAHKAEDEGVAVAEILAGQAGHVNYDVIPSVIYTAPEVASVGKTEEELKEAGIAYKVGKFPFTANGRAKVNRTTEGFVKVLADAATDRVLGVHILGADAGTMIAEAAVLMEFGGSAEDLARICHAHPTLNEAVKEAALAAEGRAIHM